VPRNEPLASAVDRFWVHYGGRFDILSAGEGETEDGTPCITVLRSDVQSPPPPSRMPSEFDGFPVVYRRVDPGDPIRPQ
jgi:hypothetical protein